jgi:predicted RNA binding protein YcfA (HicA-like mRNA interferase family)
MRFFEMHKYLQEHGFTLHRQGAKHAIYNNGDENITIPRGRTVDRRLSKHIKVVVRKACARKSEGGIQSVNTAAEDLQNDCTIQEDCLISKKKATIYERVLECCSKNSDTAPQLDISDIMSEIGAREPDFMALVTAIRKADDIEKLFGLRDALDLVGIKYKRIQKGIDEYERATRPAVEIKRVEEKKVEEIAVVVQRAEVRPPAAQVQMATGTVIKSRGLALSEKQIAALDIIKILGTLPDTDARQEVMEYVRGFNNMR